MSNKLILDLTVRLIQALDQNYDVVNMDTVLAVISALEGATITKEQLETTRLAKHINQLRRRNKSNILAIRAKNLLKKWREMFGITSQAQSEAGGAGAGAGGSSSVTQLAATQQSVFKQALSSTLQPGSPNTNIQLLGENFDNSLSSIGVDFSRTTTTTNTTSAAGGGSGSVSNTASANFKLNKKSVAGVGADAAAAIGSRSNGALGKATNRNITNNSSPATIVNATTANKVKHPTSFKNLITGFNVNNVPKHVNPSALSPKVLPPIAVVNERKMFNIDDDLNQSQPSSSTTGTPGVPKATIDKVSSPRTHKSMKRKDLNSPLVMTCMDHSSSPIAFENLSHEQPTMTTGRFSAPHHPSSRNQIITSTIDLHDSNSSSNFNDVNEIVSSTTNTIGTSSKVNGGCNSATAIGISSNSSSNKRIRKEKKRSNERVESVTESEHSQPTIDESSRIAFPISGIQEYLSLSNSSMSIFPAGSGIVRGSGTDRFQSAANEENQPADSSTERDKPDGDLTFAGKFKLNSAGGIDVESSSSYYKGGGTAPETGVVALEENKMSLISSGIGGGGNGISINNSRDIVSTRETVTNFLPFSRNSNESSSNSLTSQLDLIDVVNQDSQSMITVDDLRQLHHQKQSSNEKPTPQDIKFPKEFINSGSRQQQNQYSSKEHNMKPRPLNAYANSSKPSTPNSTVVSIVANTNVSSPPVVEQKVPKKRGRKKGSKGVDSVLAQSAGLNSQFLMSPALGSNKKVKTTRELLIDIQSRKMGSSVTSSPTLTTWFASSRPASSCSEPSLHSPRTSDANSTNATTSTAARSTPEKNASNNSIAADELYESDSDTNTSDPSHENVKPHALMAKKSKADDGGACITSAISSVEEQIKELMAMLPPVDEQKIDWETCEDIPCTCSLREIPPDVPVAVDMKTDNMLNLLENVDAIKNEEDGEEPVISVSVLPIVPVPTTRIRSSPSPTPNLPHHFSQSAPVSTVTSPVVPQTTKKKMGTNQILPTKSIFDLDFDDDNDPLHMFVEAACKTKNGIISHPLNRQESSSMKELNENEGQGKGVETDHQGSNSIKEEDSNIKSQSEQKNRLNKMPIPQQTDTPPTEQLAEPPDQHMMPLLVNFSTYEVIEDPACKAKQRYEIQTNQITQFHINAFHNCYIPNVNGNWDHSIPANNNIGVDNEFLKLESGSLYANVVPKYGCLVKERIPKDLSYIKFTSNFKPNLINKKSDKPPPLPFLGVANIHRRQHFHLHHYHRKLKKKEAAEKEKRSKDRKSKKKKQLSSKTTTKKEKAKAKTKTKEETQTIEKESRIIGDVFLEGRKNDIIVSSKKVSNILENIAIDTTPAIAMDVDDSSFKIKSKIQESVIENPLMIDSNKSNLLHDNLGQQEHQCSTINNLIKPSPEENIFKAGPLLPQPAPRLDNDQTKKSPVIEDDEKMNPSALIINGNFHHLMNNNSIIKDEEDNGLSCQKKVLNNNHHIEMNNAEGIAASRRNSSCSNSSLKQNQNSINMKLRQQRMEHLQLLEKQHKRKRKHLIPLETDIREFDPDEEENVIGEGQPLPKVPPLIKRIKLVNGTYAAETRCPANSMTDSSCLDDDNDSDCYHVHSENDIITEEEDDEDDFEEIVDDYDEEDGDDDEEEVEEDCRDFHEVVTRDMASSTTGNNHIVLTIKKTPSKTNSPSSSSMSPAPAVIQNVKISTPIVDDVAFLIDDDDNNDNNSSSRLELGKLLELNSVKAVDLITKTDFFLPETANVAVYNFQLKNNDDKDHDDEETDESAPLPIIEDHEDEEEAQQQQQPTIIAADTLPAEANQMQPLSEGDEHLQKSELKKDNAGDDKKSNKKNVSVKPDLLTHTELSESIQLTKKYLRRIELKKRLREGIEQAQKLHRQLFFPYELHTSSGSKILEINSCTSDCTDPSDDETTDSSNSDTQLTTSSSSGNGNLKSRVIRRKRRRRTKLSPGKRRIVAGGGGNPPSSSPSSSSCSSSSDSSSSASAFTSWTTSDDDDDNVDKEQKESSKVEVKKEAKEDLEPEVEVQQSELPSGNNFLLRSFNHIYVSTEERQRQQQLKQTSEYRQYYEVANSVGGGYITLSGDDSKDATLAITPLQEQQNEGYLKYFDVNSRYNAYGSQSSSTNLSGEVQSSLRQQPVSLSTLTTIFEDTSVDVETIEQASSDVVAIVEEEEEAEDKPSTVTISSVGIGVELIKPLIDVATSTTTKNNCNNRINAVRSVGSINIDINNIKNHNRSVQINNKTAPLEETPQTEKEAVKIEIQENQNEEDSLVAQEEYRTGIRRVDEDVVDEDGNNCARTQQFKEWHEVLQLRSYNDELLTVLPYVVIE